MTGDILFMAEQKKKTINYISKETFSEALSISKMPCPGQTTNPKKQCHKEDIGGRLPKSEREHDGGSFGSITAFSILFLNLGSATELIRLHGNIQLGLCNVGRQLSIGGGILADAIEGEEESNSSWWFELGDIAFSYTYIRKALIDYVGEEYLNSAPIMNGTEGMSFLESELFGTDDCIDIIVTYQVKPFGGLLSFKPFRMANRYYAHLWNGYALPTEGQSVSEEDFVYVAETGVVYHEDEKCRHLVLHIEETSCEEAFRKRNANGEKYVPCEVCALKGLAEKVYLAEDGTAIHCDRNCPGLKRTVYRIFRKDAGKYRPCSNCVGG